MINQLIAIFLAFIFLPFVTGAQEAKDSLRDQSVGKTAFSSNLSDSVDSATLRNTIGKAVLMSFPPSACRDGGEHYFSFILYYSRGHLTKIETSNLPKCVQEEKIQASLKTYLQPIILNRESKNGYGLAIVQITKVQEPKSADSKTASLDFDEVFNSIDIKNLRRKRALFLMSFTILMYPPVH